MAVFKTAFAAIYKAFTGTLRRTGVHVGETAGYPRVELHSWAEGEPMEKGNRLRELSLVVESMSTKSMAEAVTMAEENLARLLVENGVVTGGFSIVGVVPTQTTEITEATDTQNALYRVLQTLGVFVEKTTN